jgi:thiamine-monophosphate kinase
LISESDILRSFQHLVEKNDDDFVVVGSGDDAAVIKSQKKDLVHSIDISKEGTHFPNNSRPEDIAYRSIAVALSDLAAMGAYPSFITVGLTSNKKNIKWYNDFTKGLEKIIKEYDITLVGGDITFGDLNICINVFGYSYIKPLLRSTAKPNELIYITGTLGKARKGLKDWQNSKKSIYQVDFFRPKVRFDMAEFISSFASSCIDISDGLIKDLGSICKLSKVGAILKYEDIPITDDIKDLFHGDDYELCFTCAEQFEEKLKTKGLKPIGKIVEGLDIKLVKENKRVNFTKTGWDSFE